MQLTLSELLILKNKLQDAKHTAQIELGLHGTKVTNTDTNTVLFPEDNKRFLDLFVEYENLCSFLIMISTLISDLNSRPAIKWDDGIISCVRAINVLKVMREIRGEVLASVLNIKTQVDVVDPKRFAFI